MNCRLLSPQILILI